MKLRCYFSIFLRAIVLVWGISVTQGFAQEASRIEGTSQPIPPAQSEPWVPPPTALPPAVVSAITDLFRAGLADPRGCEYREIEVLNWAGHYRNDADQTLKAHGWILPLRPDDPTRYAVYWDGLVYPLVSIGAPVELDADITKFFSGKPGSDEPPNLRGIYGTRYLPHHEIALVKLPLLLRLGKVQPAEKLWKQWCDQKKAGGDSNDAGGSGPFTAMATEWLQGAYEQALRAHVRPDPKLSLACLQRIADLQAGVEKSAGQRGIALAKTPVTYRPPGPPVLDLTFLDQVPTLRADEERRVRENITNRDEEYAPAMISDKKQRIALLIRDLEDVEAHQMMMPGYLEFGSTAPVQALLTQGEEAVDSLIDCLEHDRRFTRSLDNLRVVGVEEPALTALEGILMTSAQFPGLEGPSTHRIRTLDRHALAAQVRAYWNKFRDKTLPQRWFAILADDFADPEAWAEAASDIVVPADLEIPVSGFWRTILPAKPGEVAPLRGESLRGEAHPSVSELMARRLRETLARAKTSDASFPFEPVRNLAAALARWDGRNQLETLRWYAGELQKIIALQKQDGGSGQIDDLIKAYLERAKSGDTLVLGEYAKWVRTAGASRLIKMGHSYGATFFAPVWSYPADPAIVGLTQWLFADPHSPWSPGGSGTDLSWVAASIRLPLIGVPAYRALLLEQLKNRRVVGKVERTPPDDIMVTYDYGNSERNDDPDAPPVGFKADLRLNDFIALTISKIRGAPAFKPYWLVARRDRAIEQAAAFLRQYGDRLLPEIIVEDERHSLPEPALRFSPLDHPATRDEVAAGLAIFSLEGQGERRVWPLQQTPASATWTTLKDYPSLQHRDDPVTKLPATTTTFDQDGAIWQAEEVMVAGKWQRYFGFVGRNRLAAVPAEEIYFGSSYDSEKLDGWHLSVDLAGRPEPQSLMYPATVRTGDAIPVTVSISNLRGIDREFNKATSVPRSSTAEEIGLEVHVAYSPLPLARSVLFAPKPEPKWVPVAASTSARVVDLQVATGPLTPLHPVPLARFDLAKWYDLKAPGTYLVVLKFTKRGIFDSGADFSPNYLEVTR